MLPQTQKKLLDTARNWISSTIQFEPLKIIFSEYCEWFLNLILFYNRCFFKGNEDKNYEDTGETNFDEENETLPMTVHVHRKSEKYKLPRRSFKEKDGFVRKKHKGYTTDDDGGPSQQVHTPVHQQLSTTSMPSHNENEINFFANFIASKMMKYSEATKNAVQQAICEVIFQADQKFYEANEDPLTPVNSVNVQADLPSSSIKISYSDDSDN